MRLDYFVSHSAGVPRKEARALVSGRRVRVNGEVVARAGFKLGEQDCVLLDGEELALPEHRYLMLNKPAGVVSASRDDEHRTVVDLLPVSLRRDMHPAGRLDRDTTGLVLLTTDGDWSHRVTAPGSCLEKCYLVDLADPLSEADLQPLREGMMLRGEDKPTLPARAQLLAPTRTRLWITEGRYHQVKRMFGALGNRVVALHREAIGGVSLDGTLGPGEYRALTDEEQLQLGGATK